MLGAGKVRLTGGEPLLREELPVLVGQLAGIEGIRDLALTTNGYLLADLALPLKQAGLGRVTVSLDSLDPEIHRKMNGRSDGPDRVLAGIRAAGEAGLTPIKVNAVVQRGVNDGTIVDLARRFRGTGLILRFIEYMDAGNLNGWRLDQVVPAAEIEARLGAVFPIERIDPAYAGEVAMRYRYKDGGGEMGIIASVSRPFCGECTRARLSTEGRLYTCLFGTTATDLKGPLRSGASDEEMLGIMRGAWRRRSDRYSEERSSVTAPPGRKVEMHQIGG
jgi:cyclic pyranopterin phosphate synthase